MNAKPPGKGNRHSTGKLSRVISARLHPSNEFEAEALRVWEDKIGQGFAPREILTDALLRADGQTPEMFRREGRIEGVLDALESRVEALDSLEMIDMKLGQLLDMFTNSIGDILKAIKEADKASFRAFANHDEEEAGDLELSDTFVRNARNAVRKSFRQTHEE